DCAHAFAEGETVTLTTTPNGQSSFVGWSGACTGTGACVVTMDSARSVTASFALLTYQLSVAKVGTGTGNVASSPVGIDCGDGCEAAYDAGTVVSLTATPDPGSVFAGWSGDCTGSSCVVTMNGPRSVVATFAPLTVSIDDVALAEGNAGTSGVTFTVSLSGVS